jgi:DNA-binding transcriptional ArsR family regulator
MKQPDPMPIDALERVFHEPNRLAIMSTLCASDEPISFTDLREICGLTDGNLNRHLKSLEDAGVIKVKKAFVERKPRTTVVITRHGLDRFQSYIDALGVALKQARQSIPAGKQAKAGFRPITAI